MMVTISEIFKFRPVKSRMSAFVDRFSMTKRRNNRNAGEPSENWCLGPSTGSTGGQRGHRSGADSQLS